MMLQKQVRWKSKKYLDWIKTQPCIVCGKPAEPHHLKGVGNMSGGGLKADDSMVMPLCHKHHRLLHEDPTMWHMQWEWIARTLRDAIAQGVLK